MGKGAASEVTSIAPKSLTAIWRPDLREFRPPLALRVRQESRGPHPNLRAPFPTERGIGLSGGKH